MGEAVTGIVLLSDTPKLSTEELYRRVAEHEGQLRANPPSKQYTSGQVLDAAEKLMARDSGFCSAFIRQTDPEAKRISTSVALERMWSEESVAQGKGAVQSLPDQDFVREVQAAIDRACQIVENQRMNTRQVAYSRPAGQVLSRMGLGNSMAWNTGRPSSLPVAANVFDPAGNVGGGTFSPNPNLFGYGPSGQADVSITTTTEIAPWWHYALTGAAGVAVGVIGCKMMKGSRKRRK